MALFGVRISLPCIEIGLRNFDQSLTQRQHLSALVRITLLNGSSQAHRILPVSQQVTFCPLP